MNIIFLAYRKWALDVVDEIKKIFHSDYSFKTIISQKDLDLFMDEKSHDDNIFIAIGWSWLLDAKITNQNLCLGIHPSDLPNYRGGSPIQNQILDGITFTKCSLFQLNEKIDSGAIWGKSDLSLQGDSMEEIFQNIKLSAIMLLEKFLINYPNIQTVPQDLSSGNYVRRRTPDQSRITSKDIDFTDITYLYNKIRCLTEPYPNAYIEDDLGNRIYFEKIRFEKQKVMK